MAKKDTWPPPSLSTVPAGTDALYENAATFSLSFSTCPLYEPLINVSSLRMSPIAFMT